jgi:hypothetical protein
MASFAKLNSENIIITVESVVNEVIKDLNGVEQEQLGIQFLRTLYNEPNAIWKQTSYNNRIRKNYAGIGYTYDSEHDAFIPPKPFNSWILNETTCLWNPPIDKPNDDNEYIWNEEILNWELMNG